MSNGEGRLVVITGGGKGIGRALAARYVREGAHVILTDIDGHALAEAERDLGAGVVGRYRVNVADRSEVFEFARVVLEQHGAPDILVNNAGIGHSGELRTTTIECWRRLIEVDLLGPIHHVDAFAPHMAERGRGVIANVSSGQAWFRLPTWGAYAAVKAALGTWSEVLYHELRPHGVAVVTVYPFMVNTGFYDTISGSAGTRLAMKLLPLYSMSPERVAARIHGAIERRRRLELVSPINRAAALISVLPVLPALMGRTANWFLKDRGGHDAPAPTTA